MVESNQTTDSQLRKIKIKQLQGSDIEIQVNKDVSHKELAHSVSCYRFQCLTSKSWLKRKQEYQQASRD